MNATAVQWLGAIAWVAIAELVAFASFTPAYRNDWRRWQNISWDAEAPLMYPPVFLSGALWFVLHLVNALGVFFVWRSESTAWQYHATLALWLVSIFLYALWGIPWEMELPAWTLVAWTLSGAASVACGAAAYFVALPGAILLTVYAAVFAAMMWFNWAVLLYRLCRGHDKRSLHRRWTNPFRVYFMNAGWPVLWVIVDERVHRIG